MFILKDANVYKVYIKKLGKLHSINFFWIRYYPRYAYFKQESLSNKK